MLTFATAITLNPGPASLVIASGDFTGDGKLDLVTADVLGPSPPNTLSVFPGKGDGTFGPAITTPFSGGVLQGVVAADFNGDGKLDLALALSNQTVVVLLGNGNGTFQNPIVNSMGSFVNRMVVGDFNGDGKPDLVTATSSGISELLGNGDGTFRPHRDFATSSVVNALAVGDLNGDGKQDLAVVEQSANQVEVLLGDGTGGFGLPTTALSVTSPDSLALGDLNGDGKVDLVVSSSVRFNNLFVAFGNGNGTFQSPTTYTGENAQTLDSHLVALVDLNGDGRPDVVVESQNASSLSVLLNNGDGTLQNPASYVIAPGSSALFSGDFNGDGHTDLVSAGQGATVFLGYGNGALRGVARYYIGNTQPYSYGVGVIDQADLNRDGHADLVITEGSTYGAQVAVLLGRANGTFGPAAVYSTGSGTQPTGEAVADVNGDGIPDVITANTSTNDISVLLGNGDGSFQAPLRFAAGSSPTVVAVGDFNGDGKPDIAVVGNNSVNLLLGNGDGTFQSPLFISSLFGATSVAAADLNHDGKLDLLAGGSGVFDVFLGNGDGTFQPAATYSGDVHSFVLGDMNGDGNLDVVAESGGDKALRVFLGNGDGTFQNPITTSTNGAVTGGLAVADFDQDGHADVLVTSPFAGQLLLYRGKGDGTFRAPESYVSDPFNTVLAVGDFNGDGFPDAVTANSGGDRQVTVLLGETPAYDSLLVRAPSQTVPGLPFSVVVTAQNPGGAGTDTDYTGTVHFTSSDTAAGLPADYSFTSADHGTHTFTVTLNSYPGDQTVTVTDTHQAPVSGTATVNVNPYYAARFTLTAPSRWVVGYPVTVALSAFDLYGDPATDYTGTVHLSSSDPDAVLPADFTFSAADHGTHSFQVIFHTAGSQTVTVSDTLQPALSGQASLSITPLFASPASYATGSPSEAVVAGDFDGDHNPDVVTANADGSVTFLRGNGDGTLQPASTIATFANAYLVSAAAGDFTDNGQLGVAVVDLANSRVQVLLGNGYGGFSHPQAYQVGRYPYAVAVGDLNGDGSPDLVTANIGDGTVSVLLNNGQGGFGSATNYAVGSYLSAVTIADFTGDGKADLAVAGDGVIRVLPGKGDGTFGAPITVASGVYAYGLASGDFNGDGKPDLAVPNFSTVDVLLNNGDGTFQAQSTRVPLYALAVTVADFNGDGHADIATSGYSFDGSHGLAVLLGNGDGSLQKPILFGVSQPATSLAVADLNRDRAPDLVVANPYAPSVTVLLNTDSITTHFAVSAPAESTAGSSFSFTVTALTQFGATDPAYAGTVHLGSTDQQAGLPSDYTFVPADGGQHTFTATLSTAGLQTISVTDTTDASISGQAVVNVLAGETTHFLITANPTQTVGVPFQLTVAALDAYGNIASYLGTLHFISTDEEAKFPQNYSYTESDDGVHTFLATWGTAGTQTLTVRDKKDHSITGSEVFNVLSDGGSGPGGA